MMCPNNLVSHLYPLMNHHSRSTPGDEWKEYFQLLILVLAGISGNPTFGYAKPIMIY